MGMISADLREEIDQAERLYRAWGKRIRGHDRFSQLMDRYRNAINETGRTMEQLGVVAECTACAQEGLGSCCFKGVEGWYDRGLLSIILLMGCQIPRQRQVPGHCLFVGERGCKLTARHAFCINYLCPRLKTRLGRSKITEFLAVAGHELNCGWELEMALSQWLKTLGNTPY